MLINFSHLTIRLLLTLPRISHSLSKSAFTSFFMATPNVSVIHPASIHTSMSLLKTNGTNSTHPAKEPGEKGKIGHYPNTRTPMYRTETPISHYAEIPSLPIPWPTHNPDCPPVGHLTDKQKENKTKLPALFTPITVKNVTFKNRIVVSPMCMYSSDEGFQNDWHLVHLGGFAKGGAALIFQEATAVQPNGRISPYDAGIWRDEQIPPIRRIVDFIHSQDAKAGLQIGHAGRKASAPAPFHSQRGKILVAEDGSKWNEKGWTEDVVGPSPIPWDNGWIVPREMTIPEIQHLIEDFVSATKRAQAAGFDVLEIHGAHGYLITSFLSPLSNHRTDQYGGSLENRMRLLLEVTARVRDIWTGPLSVRVSATEWVQGGWDVDDTVVLAGKLIELGVDIIDVSSGGNNPAQNIKVGPGYQLPFAEAIKKKYDAKILTAPVGMITEPEQANEIIEKGTGDFILMAREFLRSPNWPLHAAKALGVDITWAPQYQRVKL